MMQNAWNNEILEMQGKEIETKIKYNLFEPRSACPSCNHNISAIENIPILSFLALRGKCRGCKKPIGIRYLLIEVLTGGLLGLVSWKFGYSNTALFGSIFTLALVALTFIDFDTMLLPDDITYPILWIGLLFNMHTGFTDIQSAIIGAVAGYLILWSIFWIFKIVTGKEGMGYGDFKLLAAIGAWFGWQLLPAVIILSATLGAVIGIAMIVLTKRGRDAPMPFGPFLAIGAIAALFYGQELAKFYLI